MEIRYIEPELIIEINRKIIEEWNARHPEQPEFIGVSKTRLDEVLEIVRQADKGSNLKEKIIIKAAHLLGGLAGHKLLVVQTKGLQSYPQQCFYEEMDGDLQYQRNSNVNYERCSLRYKNKETRHR